MTKEHRKKLIFVSGMLEGIAWAVEAASVGEALDSVREQIEKIIKEDTECS